MSSLVGCYAYKGWCTPLRKRVIGYLDRRIGSGIETFAVSYCTILSISRVLHFRHPRLWFSSFLNEIQKALKQDEDLLRRASCFGPTLRYFLVTLLAWFVQLIALANTEPKWCILHADSQWGHLGKQQVYQSKLWKVLLLELDVSVKDNREGAMESIEWTTSISVRCFLPLPISTTVQRLSGTLMGWISSFACLLVIRS